MTKGRGVESRQNARLAMVTKGRGRRRALPASAPTFLDLPDDVIFIILRCCNLQTLGRIARVCQRLYGLVGKDCVWIWLKNTLKNFAVIAENRHPYSNEITIGVKELCRLSINWRRKNFVDMKLIHHREKQMPWLQLDEKLMWVTYRNVIKCYQQRSDGCLKELPQKMLQGHIQDVGRFVCRDGITISGARDGSVMLHETMSGKEVLALRRCHRGDVQAVDCRQDMAVSGSRDAIVKIWTIRNPGNNACVCTIPVEDRVWSLAMSPSGDSLITGTAGLRHMPPLRIWNLQRGQLLSVLGSEYKNGAGVLDVQYETPSVLWSCGYDTFLRLWDTRASVSRCVLQWEEPFDSTLYCVRSDGHYSMVTGTARFGMVELWDRRHPKLMQMYYTGRSSSPVYSLAYDAGHLYVALDKGVHMLDFTQLC